AQLVLDALALQCRDRPWQVLGAERHMVEHAGALLGQRVAMDHVQDRRVAVGGVEPPAGKLKRRPPTHPEPEEIAIEPACRFEVVAQDGEMVHGGNAHKVNSLPVRLISANAYSQAGCCVNGIATKPGAEG